jgi:hypothetical protein
VTRLELAPELVEEAAFHLARRDAERGDPRAVAWFEERERLYEVQPTAEREAAFRTHALAHFLARHLDEPLRLALAECPAAAARLATLHVRRARRAKDESAELYRATTPFVGPVPGHPLDGDRAVLALRPERFLELEPLFEFARRELLFVDDMLDERFAYAPDALDRLPLDPGRRDVVRERVARAWRNRIERRARGDAVKGRFPELVEEAVRALTSCDGPASYGQPCPQPRGAEASERAAASGTP